jgi:hypothetical protein
MECPSDYPAFDYQPMVVGDFDLFAELAAMVGRSFSPDN